MAEEKCARIAQSMQRDWDKRSPQDVHSYIASRRKDRNKASFYRSSEEVYQRLASPPLERDPFLTEGKPIDPTAERYMNWQGRVERNRTLHTDAKIAGNRWPGVVVNDETLAPSVCSKGRPVLEPSGIYTPMAWSCRQ
jgi:hypothetical protein